MQDACLVCNGDNSSCLDCAGIPNGASKTDRCGECGVPWAACTRDCSGVWGGAAVRDGCSVCNGDNSSCADCNGIPFGPAIVDRCAACVQPGDSCLRDCAGVWGGAAVEDICGVCHGDGQSCLDCAGVVHGSSIVDACGLCVQKRDACAKDCAGEFGGGRVVDQCGICGGDDVCHEAFHIGVDIPGSLHSFDEPARESIRESVAVALGIDLSFVNIIRVTEMTAAPEPTVSFDFELLVQNTADGGRRRRRLQWVDLATGLSSAVASSTGIDPDKVLAGTPVEIAIDCNGDIGGDAAVDICGVCAGDNGTCTDCAGNVQPMYCSVDGTSSGRTDAIPSRVGLAGTWQCEDGTVVVFAARGASLHDDCLTCDSDEENDCLPNCRGKTGPGIGIPAGSADLLIDECGVCGGAGDSCADCAGVPNGNATVDHCGTCDDNGSNDCTPDCAGVWGGVAEIDACSVCDTNSTNDGATCADCAGLPNGVSSVDGCGTCDANVTNDCTLDCAGVWGGSAEIDECLVCAGDSTSCADCFGVPNGLGEVDECGECTNVPCNRDCAGVWGGLSVLDVCGVCDNSTENDDVSCTVDSHDSAVPDAVLTMQALGDANLDDIITSMAAAMDVPIEAIEVVGSTVKPNRTADVGLSIAIEDLSSMSARADFAQRFCSDVAALLGIQQDRVEVVHIAAGSIVVTFTVAPNPSDGSMLDTDALRTALSPTTSVAGSAIGELIVHPAPAIEVGFAIRSAMLDSGRVVSDVLLSLEQQVANDAIAGLAPGQSVFASLSMVCPLGYYGSSDGGCVRCPLGSEPNAAQDGCEPCQRLAMGDQQTWASTDGGACILCEAGKAPNDARTACVACEAGTFNDGSGMACARCSDPTMVPTVASDACVCPSGSAQFPIGSFDSSQLLLSCFVTDYNSIQLSVHDAKEGRACMTCSNLPGPGLSCAECNAGMPFALDGWSLSKKGRERYLATFGVASNASANTLGSVQEQSTLGGKAVPARNLFRCPYEGACLGEDPANSSLPMRCSRGYTGNRHCCFISCTRSAHTDTEN